MASPLKKQKVTAGRKLVIIGGVAAGMSAAARARRLSEEAEIVVFERSGYVSYANCGLPYYLGREIPAEKNLLLQTPEGLKKRFELDVRVNSEVVRIDKENKSVTVLDRVRQESYEESYDDLILAVGASPIRPQVPGIELPGVFSLRSVEDLQSIDRWIEDTEPKKAVVVGGGFIGIEMAEQLSRRGLKVTLVDGGTQVLTPLDPEMATLLHRELESKGIVLQLASFLKEFRAVDESGTRTTLVYAGEHEPIRADLIILGLGVRPEVKLALEADLNVGQRGGILVNDYLQSSDKSIWAVGDAIEVVHPVDGQLTRIALGGPANRQGRIVADNIFGKREKYKGTLGTAILRAFDLTVAMLGLNEAQVKRAGIAYEVLYVHPSHHASYFPGAERLDMKVLFQKESGAILGAQIVGREGVDKRIDVLATAVQAGLKVQDLAELELAYAPPFGSAKDPINILGMAAKNVLEGYVEQARWSELADLNSEDSCLLDVRSKKERDAGYIPGSLHIPLPELRKSLASLPDKKNLLVYCQSGQRSYYATRFLLQNGFAVKNLPGGYLTWKSLQF